MKIGASKSAVQARLPFIEPKPLLTIPCSFLFGSQSERRFDVAISELSAASRNLVERLLLDLCRTIIPGQAAGAPPNASSRTGDPDPDSAAAHLPAAPP